jgi:proteasome lid subunit RPN8/RPN11
VDSDHEGLVFLCGREIAEDLTLLCTAIAPDCEHDRLRVQADEHAIAAVVRAARGAGLAVLAQVHSHPDHWTRHSDGDNVMILMPFKGMLSIVAPHYGRVGMRPLHVLGVHQYQDGSWRVATEDSSRSAITIAPAAIDLR